MKDSEILEEITSQNPWWQNGKIALKEKTIKRDLYPDFKKHLDNTEVQALVGLRRVGKTTVFKTVIKNLLEKGVEPKRIFYFSLDILRHEKGMIKHSITLYFTQILRKIPEELEERVYILLDEVQKAPEWGEVIKSYYDKEHQIKFLVSGSSSMNILTGSGESLVGRIIIFRLYPFSFIEFLRYSDIKAETMPLDKIRYPLNPQKIAIAFEEYKDIGGFPETFEKSPDETRTYLKTMIDLTFYRDIATIFETKRLDVLEGLFYSFIKESGNIVNYRNLSTSLNTKFETIKTYIEHLSSSFLISKSRYYTGSTIKSFEKNMKIYASDHAFSNLQDMEEGLLVETMIHNHMKPQNLKIRYWKDRRNEVDIICNSTPIEVKYKSRITKQDIKGLLKFMERFDSPRGIVVTKDIYKTEEKQGKVISYIPAWLFLLSKNQET